MQAIFLVAADGLSRCSELVCLAQLLSSQVESSHPRWQKSRPRHSRANPTLFTRLATVALILEQRLLYVQHWFFASRWYIFVGLMVPGDHDVVLHCTQPESTSNLVAMWICDVIKRYE